MTVIQDQKYIQDIKNTIEVFDPQHVNRYALFGSSTREDRFGDIDIAVVGNKKAQKPLYELRALFEGSTLPYFVDVVDVDSASESFSHYVFNNEHIVWLN